MLGIGTYASLLAAVGSIVSAAPATQSQSQTGEGPYTGDATYYRKPYSNFVSVRQCRVQNKR